MLICDHGNNRNRCQEVFYEKFVLKKFVKFTGTHFLWSIFFVTLKALSAQFYSEMAVVNVFSSEF